MKLVKKALAEKLMKRFQYQKEVDSNYEEEKFDSNDNEEEKIDESTDKPNYDLTLFKGAA